MNYPTRAEIEELSPDERLRLIDDVWETFEAAPESLELSQSHRELLERRLEQFEKDPDATVSWDEALQRLRRSS